MNIQIPYNKTIINELIYEETLRNIKSIIWYVISKDNVVYLNSIRN